MIGDCWLDQWFPNFFLQCPLFGDTIIFSPHLGHCYPQLSNKYILKYKLCWQTCSDSPYLKYSQINLLKVNENIYNSSNQHYCVHKTELDATIIPVLLLYIIVLIRYLILSCFSFAFSLSCLSCHNTSPHPHHPRGNTHSLETTGLADV